MSVKCLLYLYSLGVCEIAPIAKCTSISMDICMLRHLIVSVPRLVRSHALSINVMAAIRLTAGRASNTTQFMCVLVNKTVA